MFFFIYVKNSQGVIHILEGLIIGILLIQFGLPVLESLTSLVMTMIEAAKGYFGTIVTKYNIAIQEKINPEEVVNPIGFYLPEE